MPIKIVLDTNIFFNKWFLEGPQFELLRRHVASGRSIVFIPSVVILELKTHYLKKVSEHVNAVQKLTHVLPPGYTAPPLPLPQTVADDYPRYLRSRISELGLGVDHILRYELEAMAPYGPGASAGLLTGHRHSGIRVLSYVPLTPEGSPHASIADP